MANNDERLVNIVKSLDRVNDNTKKMVFEMAQSMTELEIIQSFNQQSFDTFNLLIHISRKMQKDDICKMDGYKKLFENAIKINVKLPVDKFTILILEYASEIYGEEEDCFLKMSIPDTNINVSNEFGIVRSKMFQDLWKLLGQKDKSDIKGHFILLTTFAHAFFYKTLLQNQK